MVRKGSGATTVLRAARRPLGHPGRRVREVEFLRRLSVSQNAVQLGVRRTVGPDQGPQGTLGASVRP